MCEREGVRGERERERKREREGNVRDQEKGERGELLMMTSQ